jgi:hypothetical protein
MGDGRQHRREWDTPGSAQRTGPQRQRVEEDLPGVALSNQFGVLGGEGAEDVQ